MAVLIVSASLELTNLARVMEEGANEVVDKLVPPVEVIDAIRHRGTGSRCTTCLSRISLPHPSHCRKTWKPENNGDNRVLTLHGGGQGFEPPRPRSRSTEAASG